MICKTSREVLLHALQLAGVQNMGFTDFFNTIALMNNEYRKIYEDIATSEDGYYDCEVILSGNDIPLPEDVWIVKRVVRMNGDIEVGDLLRMPGKTSNVAGQYYISGNRLIINASDLGPIKIVYAPKPQTITVPEDPLLTPLDYNIIDQDFVGMNENTFYYKNVDGQFYEMSLDDGIIKESAEQFSSNTIFDYLDGTLTVDNQLKEYIYTTADESINVNDVLSQGKEIDFVTVSDPYLAVTYTDKTIKIFNGWNCADYNIFAYKGKQTKGKILTMYTNDYTGKGVIFYNAADGKIYYASFVPDTVLNYPEQADFSLLEWKIAANLSQMAGTESEWILNNLANAEVDFQKQLKRCRGSTMRINNVRGRAFRAF